MTKKSRLRPAFLTFNFIGILKVKLSGIHQALLAMQFIKLLNQLFSGRPGAFWQLEGIMLTEGIHRL